MASRDINLLHPLLKQAFEYTASEFRSRYPDAPIPVLTATYRSGEEQDALYKQRPKVTNAKAGQSAHNYNPSFAFDVAFQSGKVLDWSDRNFNLFAGLLKAKYGNAITWGGDFKSFKDKPHFEVRGWKYLIPKALPVLKLEIPPMVDDAVKVVQKALGLKEDGVYGPMTEQAVKGWQCTKGLKADGVVGPVTYKAMGIV